MDPEILRAIQDGHSPQEVAAELQRRGLPVPPELVQMTVAAPDAAPADASRTPAQNAVVAGLGAAGVGTAYGAVKGTQRVLPSGFAKARLNRAVEQSGGRSGIEQLLREYEQAGQGRDKIVTLGDLSIPLGEQGTDFVGTNSEAGRARLLQMHQARQRGVPGRLLGDAAELAPEQIVDPVARAAEVKKVQQEWAASPEGYEGLRAANPTIDPRWNRQLLTFTQSDKLAGLWKQAAEVGLVGPTPPASATSFEVLHDLKQRLDDAVSAGFLKGHGTLARRLASARDELDGLLESAVPGYSDVNARYRAFTREQELLLQGRDIWRSGDMHVSTIKSELDGLTAQERRVLRQGLLGAYVGDIEAAKTNRNFANEMMARDLQTSAKLEAIFGSKAAFDEAVSRFTKESMMARVGGYVGGSATARRLGAGTSAADAAAEGVVESAHSPGLLSVLDRFAGKLPAMHRAKTAKLLEPYFTTQGTDAIRDLLRSLPK